jgi:hypothetical protein
MPPSLTPLTGELDLPLPLDPSKTKDNADHAGLSPLLDLLKEPLPFSEPKNSNLSLNLNWLTAHHPTETKDAMEDLWTTLSNMLKNTESPLKTNTHTTQSLEDAKSKEEISKSHLTMMLPKEMLTNSPSPLPNNQFPSLLMPITSNSTLKESSLTVNNLLTTELPLLDTPLKLGSSKTLGEKSGENLDTSDSREETPVDLLTLPHTLFSEKYEFIYILI